MSLPTNFDQLAVENFRDFLSIPSVHPDIDYSACLDFLKGQAKSLDLPWTICQVHPGKPVFIFSWLGSEPELPSIWLNCHMDVVPVFSEKWTYPPFDAHMDSQGNIYARGAQDMKCVGIMYLEAIRRLKHNHYRPKRTIHVGFVPDEEIGGILGMKLLVKHKTFLDLNIGFALDEGMTTPDDSYVAFNDERTNWVVMIHCTGKSGDSSSLLDDTAGQKLQVVLNRYSKFRREQKKKVEEGLANLESLVSANLTLVKGGHRHNILPDLLTAGFDMRLPSTCDFDEVEAMLVSWCKDAGEGVRIEFKEKNAKVVASSLNDNPFWTAFQSVFQQTGKKLTVKTCPATTDMKFIRQAGIPAFSFSPMCNTPNLVHDHDEFLNKDVFLDGIKLYMKIIPALSNV